jgi:hypothetical protein
MWPLLLLFGGVTLAVAADSGSSSSSSSPKTGGGGGTTSKLEDAGAIEMTCDDAIAFLPSGIRDSVAAAITSGTNRKALLFLASTLEDQGNATNVSTDAGAHLSAALLIAAHCVNARADTLADSGASIFADPPPEIRYTSPPSYVAPVAPTGDAGSAMSFTNTAQQSSRAA